MVTNEQIFRFVLGRAASELELSEFARKGAEASIVEFINSYEFHRFTLDPFYAGNSEELRKAFDPETAAAIMQSVFLDPGFGYASNSARKLDRRIPGIIYTLLHPHLLPRIRQALPEKIMALRTDRVATPQDVELCYRSILNRAPENTHVVQNAAFLMKGVDIIANMLDSEEFKVGALFVQNEGERCRLGPWNAKNLSFA